MLSDDTVRRVAAARLPGVLQPPPIYFAPWRSARQLFYVRIFRGGSRRYARTSVQVQPHGTRRSAGAGQIESHFCQNVEMEFWRSQERRLGRSLAKMPRKAFVTAWICLGEFRRKCPQEVSVEGFLLFPLTRRRICPSLAFVFDGQRLRPCLSPAAHCRMTARSFACPS